MSWLSLSHFAIRPSARTFFCLSLYLAYLDLFFCIPVFPSLFVCKIHLSVCPIVYLHPHVLLYVLLSFFKLFVNPHFRPSDWSSLCHCVISSLFSQSPFLSINSGWYTCQTKSHVYPRERVSYIWHSQTNHQTKKGDVKAMAWSDKCRCIYICIYAYINLIKESASTKWKDMSKLQFFAWDHSTSNSTNIWTDLE